MQETINRILSTFIFRMNKEIELEYLENILASSRDMVSALDAIAAQFRSMEKASQGRDLFLNSFISDMITIFQNWNTVFSVATKASSSDVAGIVLPEKKD